MDMDFWVNHFTGAVTDRQQWTDSITTGGEVSGFMTGNGGMVVSKPIKTKLIRNLRLFLVDKDGREQHVHAQDIDLSVQVGNTVTAVWGGRKQMKQGPCVALHNHNTGQTAFNQTRIYKLPVHFGRAVLMALCSLGGWIPGGYLNLEYGDPNSGWAFIGGMISSWIVLNVLVSIWFNRDGRKLHRQIKACLAQVAGDE